MFGVQLKLTGDVVVVKATLGVGLEQVMDTVFKDNVPVGMPASSATLTVAGEVAEVLQPLRVLVTITEYVPAPEDIIGLPVSVELVGVVHV